MSFEEKQSGRRDGRTTPFSFGIPVHGNRFVRPLQKHYRPIHYNEMSQRHRGPSWVCIVSRDRHTDKYVSTKTRTRTYSMTGRLLLLNKKVYCHLHYGRQYRSVTDHLAQGHFVLDRMNHASRRRPHRLQFILQRQPPV